MKLFDRVASVFGYQKQLYDIENSGFSTLGYGLTTAASPRPSQSNVSKSLNRYADEAWVYSCIRIIQTKAAGVDLKVYKVTAGKKTELPDHPLKALLDSVNPFMDGYGLREATHGYKESSGNSFWLLDRMVDAVPTEIHPLNPTNIKVLVDKKLGVVGYQFVINGQVVDTYGPEEILHFKHWNPNDPFWGQPPLSAGRDAADMMKAADQYNIAFFKNSAEPGGFLTTDKPLSEDSITRIKSAWAKNHQSARKAHTIEILHGGLDYKQTTMSHADMMFPELKSMSRAEVLSCYNVPPVMVGVIDSPEYGQNVKEQRKIFWEDCIKPRLKAIESVINERLAKPYGDVIVEHDTSVIDDLKEDAKTKAERDEIHTRSGIKKINEVRAEMNLPPVPWGNTWNAPIGLLSIESHQDPMAINDQPAANDQPPAKSISLEIPLDKKEPDPISPPSNPITEDLQKLRRDKIWSLFKMQTESMERRWFPVLRSLFSGQEKEVINNLRSSNWEANSRQIRMDEMRTFRTKIQIVLFDRAHSRKVFRKEGLQVMTFTLAEKAKEEIKDYGLGIDFSLTNPRVSAWLATKSFKFAEELNRTTEDALHSALEEAVKAGESISDVEKRIADVFDIARGSRTNTIARTEVISASNKGAYEAYRQAGVEKTEWISARDEKVRELHQIDGEQVEIDQTFSNGLAFPGDLNGDAENVINCRCGIAPIVSKGD